MEDNFVDVEPDPFVGKFLKFTKIGETFEGYFVGTAPGNYGKTDYTFRTSTGEEKTIGAKGDLLSQFRKCQLKPGSMVRLQLKDLRDIGKENPMPVYRVSVNHTPKVPMPPALDEGGDYVDEGEEAPF